MTVLVNRSFIYLITLGNPFINTFIKLITDVINCEQDSFIYIIIEYYISKEFYSAIIDINAFKKSTVSYRQYFAYKTIINNNTDIDII